MSMEHRQMPQGWTWYIGMYASDLRLVSAGQVGQSEAAAGWRIGAGEGEAETEDEHELMLRGIGKHTARHHPQSPWIYEDGQGRRAMQGSFLYGSMPNQQDEEELRLQYHVTEHGLFTSPLQYDRMDGVVEAQLVKRMEHCATACAAFFCLLSELAQVCLTGLDAFADQLTELERQMRKFNNSKLLDTLITRQYDLVHWQHRIVPLEELLIAAKEAFPETLKDNEPYRMTTLRVERLKLRMARFTGEVTAMLSMDENIASYRGNEIMKTLTVFTVVCTPATLLAGIWGMNFNRMPELDHPLGYVGSLAAIFLLTLLVYVWLWWKGWTGDLIRGKRKDSNLI